MHSTICGEIPLNFRKKPFFLTSVTLGECKKRLALFFNQRLTVTRAKFLGSFAAFARVSFQLDFLRLFLIICANFPISTFPSQKQRHNMSYSFAIIISRFIFWRNPSVIVNAIARQLAKLPDEKRKETHDEKGSRRTPLSALSKDFP